MKSLGERVTHAIDSLDIKRNSIQKRGGPSRPTLWRIENDPNYQPTNDGLNKLTKAFKTYGVSEDWLLQGQEPMILSPLAMLTEEELSRAAETSTPYSVRTEPPLDRKLIVEVLKIVITEAHSRTPEQLASVVLIAYDQAVSGISLDQVREKVRMWFS